LKQKFYIYLLLTFLILIGLSGYTQKNRGGVENLPKFDRRWYHFGFLIGVNQMNFVCKTVDDYTQFDSLQTIQMMPQPGFNIGIVSSLRIIERLTLRFVPTLSFGDRGIQYQFVMKNGEPLIQTKRVESTSMDFPFYLKYASKRLTNAQAFIIVGAKYSIDLASQAKKKARKGDDLPIKLWRDDYLGEIGTGFDFFLPYFKLGFELKMSYGFKNLIYREDNIYNNSIMSLKSKIFQFSITFEG